jgi:hypothetical protein
LSDIELDYEYLMQRAQRRVVYDALSLTAELKATPGDHHFYIEFLTGAFGVSLPDELRQEYPERMTIVLQHQFENLIVDEEGFSVSLWFKGKQSRLTIPYEAITSFADPSAHFGLRFHEPEGAVSAPAAQTPAAKLNEATAKAKEADVVKLDTFRKK